MILPDNENEATAKLKEVRAEAARHQSQATPSVASKIYQPREYSEISAIEGDECLLSTGTEAAVLAIGSGAEQSSDRRFLLIKPTNFVALSVTRNSIMGTWAIDPGMFMPSDLLQRGQMEESRPNISFVTIEGSVDVDVYVLNVNGDDYDAQTRTKGLPPRRQVVIHGESRKGSHISRIREIAPSSSASRRLPLKIMQKCDHGSIKVYLPRTFEGPVSAKTMDGITRYSPSVTAELTRFSNLSGMQRAFIGCFKPSHWVQEPGASWQGDELTLETIKGSILVHYLDDLELPPIL